MHAADATVVSLAFAAFTNMLKLETSLKALVDEGVPELVVSAMRAHADNGQVQELACRVLILIMSDPGKGVLAVRATDAVSALNAAITRHSAARDVVLTVYHLLQTLGWKLDLGAGAGPGR